MKRSEIKVGGEYLAKVNGCLTIVRVDSIRDRHNSSAYQKSTTPIYEVTNLNTGRTTTFHSAAKFRGVSGAGNNAEGEKRSDPTAPAAKTPALTQTTQTDRLTAATVEEPSPGGSEQSTTEIDDEDEDGDIGFGGPGLTAPLPEKLPEKPLTTFNRSVLANVQQMLDQRPTAVNPARIAELTGMPPTDEQQLILEAGVNLRPGDVLVIEAGAGTGKTSTLKMLEQVLAGRLQYTAYNASLVAESKSKFKKAHCNTTHSLGFREVGKKFAHRLNKGRVRAYEIATKLGIEDMTLSGAGASDPVTGIRSDKVLSAGFLASQVMGAIKRFTQSADKVVSEKHFRYIDGIDQPESLGEGKSRKTHANNEIVRAAMLPFLRAAWKDLSDVDGTLPFSHDCYVKAWELDNPVISADYILLDEDQDTAEVMVSVLSQQRSAIKILVGDSSQMIYQWRGAVNAIDAFPDAPKLWLTQSFRFGHAIADVANSILASLDEPTELRLKGLPGIDSKVHAQPRPRSPEQEANGDLPGMREVDCVLCRTNAAAVATVLNAIGEGKKSHLVGGGAEVLSFVKAARTLQQGRTTDHPELACFTSWGEVVEYSETDEGEDLKLLVKLITEFTAEAIIGALENMPAEKDADLVVCTAHKSKGREWNRVRLAPDFPTNGKSSDDDRRLLYVAATRAKLELDVSVCPFFTGQDALVIKRTAPTVPTAPAPAAAPAQPALPRSPRLGYSWAKFSNTWCVRGPRGTAVGTQVEVEARNGRRASKRIVKVVRDFDDATIYEVS
jgi:hypothetical protein